VNIIIGTRDLDVFLISK